MTNFEFLPTMHEEDVGFGRECEVHTQQSSYQKAAMDGNELEVNGENDAHALEPSPQEIAVPGNKSEDVTMTNRAAIESQNQGQSSNDTQKVPVGRVTRAAKKRQEKVVESPKQAKAGSAKETPVKVEVCVESCQSELKDIKEELTATKAQLTGKRKELATCRRKLRESKSVSHHVKRLNRNLQETLKAEREQLSKCKDDVFSLQGVAQTPDSTILKRFESLSQQIIHWIDTEVATYEKAHPEAEPDRVFSVGEQKRAAGFLRLYPDAGEHLARHLIHRALQIHVFGKEVYFFGLPEETTQLLQEAELKLAKSDPRRDSVAIASWRSETLKALVKTTKCVDYCQQQAQDLTTNLFKGLSMALPELFSGSQTHATFYDQVLLPAVKLANTIKMSTTEYVVMLPQLLLDNFKPATIDMLKMCKIVDSQTGKHLKPDSAVVTDNDGVIGHFTIFIEPELHRVIRGKETTLYQGTVLVELHHPMGKRIKTST